MKKLTLFLLMLLLCSLVGAQSIPESFSYQAVARDASGMVLSNQNINIQLSILDGSASGSELYVERHENIMTNGVGHFQVNIGEGTVQTTGTLLNFSEVDWRANSRFLKVELADGGTTNYNTVGETQFLGVPYAQVAEVVDSADVAIFAYNGKLTNPQNADSISFLGANDSLNVAIGGLDLFGPNHGQINLYDDNAERRVRISSESNRGGAGNIALSGANGSANITLGHNGSSGVNKGRLLVRDENSDTEASLFIDANGMGVVAADLKPFFMDHPTQPGKEIWYCAIEGPEAAAYERGTAQLINGEAEITFSDHFQIVANPQNMTITTSPWSADAKGLAVIERTATGFKVKELFGGTGNYQFDWRVDAKRKGHENFQVIRDKKDSPFE